MTNVVYDPEFTPPEIRLLTAVFALALRDFHAEVKRTKNATAALNTRVGRWLMSQNLAPEFPDRPITCRFICEHLGLPHHAVRYQLQHNWRSLMAAVQTLQTESERGATLSGLVSVDEDEWVSERDAALFLGIGARELAKRRRDGVSEIPFTVRGDEDGIPEKAWYRMGDLIEARGEMCRAG